MPLSYDLACFYKLLLQAGYNKEVNSYINEIVSKNDELEGINLDLVCNLLDLNRLISVLHNYIGENKINKDLVCNMLREFIFKKYSLNEIALKDVAYSFMIFSNTMERDHGEYCNDFFIIGDYYHLVCDGIINIDKYTSIVSNYLKTGKSFDSDGFFNKREKTFKDLMLEEKKEMNPIRFKMNYIIVPIFLLFTIMCIAIILITLSINEEKYTPLAIVLFCAIGLFMLGLLVSIPFVRKKEIILEMGKYDFSLDNCNIDFYSIKSIEGEKFIFKKTGITIKGIEYPYDSFCNSLIIYRYLLTVKINIEFVLLLDNDTTIYYNIRLDNKLYNAIKKFDIEILPSGQLDYIVENTYDSFKQIYKYGYIKKCMYKFNDLKRNVDVDIIKAHDHSSNNRDELKKSNVCGCFYCKKIFNPSEISEWIDDGKTAICPHCGIDSVIANESGYPINKKFMTRMHIYWFK